LSKGTGPKELYVKKIRNGTVIDHILAGHALDVLKILGIHGGEGHIVSVAMNVISKKQIRTLSRSRIENSNRVKWTR